MNPARSPIDPGVSMGEGRTAYFAANDLPADGGYTDDWVKLEVLGIPIAFPNTSARKRQVPFHDLHHVLTGYGTDLVGEAEIGAWEIGSGCDSAARFLNMQVMGFVVLGRPGRLFRAFRWGRQCRNLYPNQSDAPYLERKVGQVRAELGLEEPLPPPSPADRIAFAGWSALAFLQGAVPTGGIVAGLWWWLA